MRRGQDLALLRKFKLAAIVPVESGALRAFLLRDFGLLWSIDFRAWISGLRRPLQIAYSLTSMATPLVGIIMGSTSDWETMQHTTQTLDSLGIPYEKRVISAHRTPQLAFEWAGSAEARGLKVVIAAAGGAAHLAGVAAALTPLPVLGVPMESASLKGLDSLLSMVQMPGGIPVATFAIGKPGAINAALFAAAILGLGDIKIKKALDDYRAAQSKKVAEAKLP
jgi:5-(carboxyamino)imidazole ribonucleotide mutase